MQNPHAWLIALVPAAYLLGSAPFGLLVGLARGVDVRKGGSGNIGATNVGRLLGGRFFALVFLLDLLKGLLPVLAAGWIIGPGAGDRLEYLLWLTVGFAAIAGHMCSLFLRFAGGKGVATSTGVVLGIWPFYTVPGLLAAVVFLVSFKFTRIVSISSIIGAVVFPALYLACAHLLGGDPWGAQLPLLGFALLLAALIVYRHRSNIARLRSGTEHRFDRKASENGKPLTPRDRPA